MGKLKRLRRLSLGVNGLKTVPWEINNLKNLKSLSLSGQDLSDFDCAPFLHLEELSFIGTQFWLLPQNMNCLPHLKYLNLSYGGLHHIPVEVKSLEVEELTIYLSGNAIPEQEIEALRRERPGWEIEY